MGGCESLGSEFCNHDEGNGHGFCEPCPANVNECKDWGLPQLGEKSCETYCKEFVKPNGCEDTDNGIVDSWGDSCEYYNSDPQSCGMYDTDQFKSMEMCCTCKHFSPDNTGDDNHINENHGNDSNGNDYNENDSNGNDYNENDSNGNDYNENDYNGDDDYESEVQDVGRRNLAQKFPSVMEKRFVPENSRHTLYLSAGERPKEITLKSKWVKRVSLSGEEDLTLGFEVVSEIENAGSEYIDRNPCKNGTLENAHLPHHVKLRFQFAVDSSLDFEVLTYTETMTYTLNDIWTAVLATSNAILALFAIFFTNTLPSRYFTFSKADEDEESDFVMNEQGKLIVKWSTDLPDAPDYEEPYSTDLEKEDILVNVIPQDPVQEEKQMTLVE